MIYVFIKFEASANSLMIPRGNSIIDYPLSTILTKRELSSEDCSDVTDFLRQLPIFYPIYYPNFTLY